MAERTSIRRLARRFNLRIVSPAALTIRRKRHGRGFRYEAEDGAPLKDAQTLARLKRLCSPASTTPSSTRPRCSRSPGCNSTT